MRKIKLSLLLISFLLFTFFISSCKKTNPPSPPTPSTKDLPSSLVIYTVNDFHGSLEEEDGKYGIARSASYILDSSKKAEAYVILSAGDMFQGSAISNYNHGKSVIEMMNYIGFDAMAIGNHEFDWSLEETLKYRDKDTTNGEANFPYISCNLFDKRTNSLPNFIEPYTIVERSGLKIGIIGYIGYGIEEDIATNMVANYEFRDPVTYIKQYSKKLRIDFGCDVVIALGHDGDATTDKLISKLSGEERIDAIINGHSHSTYVDTYRRDDGYALTCIQAGSAGKYVGVVTLSLNEEGVPKESNGFTKQMSSSIRKDENCTQFVNKLLEETAPIFGRVLCVANEEINRLKGTKWAVNALQEAMKTDCAFINGGGIRSNAFPIAQNEEVKVSKVYQIMPFDNTIKTTVLKGKYILSLIHTADIYYGDSITGDELSGYYINGKRIEEEKEYTVSAVDYIFDKENMPFKNGSNSISTGILFRDILLNALEEYKNTGWSI